MKYWAYLAAKLLAVGFALYYIWAGIRLVLPPAGFVYRDRFLYRNQFLGFDLAWTLAACVFFVICCGAVFLVLLDQRYRCRVCLRRLRMPVAAGSWGQMLQFGRPSIEYICPFGHGTLKVPAVQILGLEAPDWQRHDDDIWKELISTSEEKE
jgi:hypothetical protein